MNIYTFLFLLLIPYLFAPCIQAGAVANYYKSGNSMTVVNKDITIEISGKDLPKLSISSNALNDTQYTLQFDSMFQVSQTSGSQRYKVGNAYSLSNYKWIIGDATVNQEIVSFSAAGSSGKSNPYISFVIHVNGTGRSFKFDVSILNFPGTMWESNAIGLTTCYSTTTTSGNGNETNVNVDVKDKKECSFGGANLSIISNANLLASTKTVNAQLQPGDKANSMCIVYNSFHGKSTGLVHDPTLAMSAASSIQIAFMAMIISFFFIFL